jgi:hypothetical protein
MFSTMNPSNKQQYYWTVKKMRNLDVDVLFESASNFNSILNTVLILLGKKILMLFTQEFLTTSISLLLRYQCPKTNVCCFYIITFNA